MFYVIVGVIVVGLLALGLWHDRKRRRRGAPIEGGTPITGEPGAAGLMGEEVHQRARNTNDNGFSGSL